MSARCHGKEIPLYSKWIMSERKWVLRFVHSLELLVSFRPHLVGALGRRRWKREDFVPLHFRKAENDLSNAMLQGYVMDGFVLLCLSILRAFLHCHSFFLFSEKSHYFHHRPHFSQIHCICPCLAKGKKKPFCRSWISFPCPHIQFFIIFLWCGITMRYFTVHTI